MSNKNIKNKEYGFTLIELLTAGTLFLLLSLSIIQIVLHAEKMAEAMITNVVLNKQARVTFELLAHGGNTTGGYNAAIPSPVLYNLPDYRGYYARSEDPTIRNHPVIGHIGTLTGIDSALTLRNGANTDDPLNSTDNTFQLRLGWGSGDNTSGTPATTDFSTASTTNYRRTPSYSQTFQVSCSGVDTVPISRCEANTDIYTVDGFIDTFNSDANIRTVNSRTSEVAFTIIDPSKVPRTGSESLFTQPEYSESYWTVFSINVDP
jgi:Tfp pilus assembly protein PilW